MEHLGRLRKPLLAAPLIIEFVAYNSTFTTGGAKAKAYFHPSGTVLFHYSFKVRDCKNKFQGESVIMCEDLDVTQCVENPTNE